MHCANDALLLFEACSVGFMVMFFWVSELVPLQLLLETVAQTSGKTESLEKKDDWTQRILKRTN